MKVIATASALENQNLDPSDTDQVILREEQRAKTEEKLRKSVADWWARYLDFEIAPEISPEEFAVRIDDIQADAENLWDRAFTGWQNEFFQSDLPSTASIELNAAKTRMTGSVLPDVTKNFRQLVAFDIRGSGLGLNDQSYTVNQFTLQYLVPNTDNVLFTVNFDGNLSFDERVLNTDSLLIRKLSMSAGGFIDLSISGYGVVNNQPVKTIDGSTIRLAVFDFRNANIDFSINNDPARKSDVFKISVGGHFKAYLDDFAQRAAEPVQVINDIEIQLGDLRLALTQLNIRSTASEQTVENELTQAIFRSLRKTGIDLGFSVDLGNALRLDVENARFIRSSADPYAYSAKGLVFSVSVDTELGEGVVPLNIKIKLNANFNLKTKEVQASITQFHAYAKASALVPEAFDILIDDILIPASRLSEIESDTITNLISSIAKVNLSKTPTTFSYDKDVDVSDLSVVSAVMLTGQADAAIFGNGRDNVLTGNSGNNRLDGAAGRDVMLGGSGDDQYVIDSRGDRAIERSGDGVDTVHSSVNYLLGRNLENLFLMDQQSGPMAIIGRGNSLDNRIEGNSGRNFLTGGGGHDVLDGQLGNDRLTGGPGNDHFVFSLAPHASQNFDTITDFVRGQDKLVLSPNAFPKWSPGQLAVMTSPLYSQSDIGADAHLIFNPYTQQLLYDDDAVGGLAPLPVVFLSGVTNLNASDILADWSHTFTPT